MIVPVDEERCETHTIHLEEYEDDPVAYHDMGSYLSNVWSNGCSAILTTSCHL